jgi:8-oxo-dGTP pyrophosphatase MutT (NUDIX family)
MSWTDRLLRILLTAAHKGLLAGWFLRRPRTFGAHALALTPEGKLVLVKLRYAPGWRIPGGGRAPDEDPSEAALRELREEIGWISHGAIRLAGELEEQVHFKRDLAALLIVENVRYRPRKWSLEVEQVGEFNLDNLPADMAQTTRRWIDALRPHI